MSKWVVLIETENGIDIQSFDEKSHALDFYNWMMKDYSNIAIYLKLQ